MFVQRVINKLTSQEAVYIEKVGKIRIQFDDWSLKKFLELFEIFHLCIQIYISQGGSINVTLFFFTNLNKKRKRVGIYIYVYFKSERIKFKGTSARGLELYCRALYLMFLRNDEFFTAEFRLFARPEGISGVPATRAGWKPGIRVSLPMIYTRPRNESINYLWACGIYLPGRHGVPPCPMPRRVVFVKPSRACNGGSLRAL